ncbi:hypothetical protein KC19_4G175400 [Ceratodon purpureus]|uniref:Uncharacterized protein n=1 Tax=Ceratodon purpureus TaxID=3225 RepID=A0A8T0IBU6_CERPU|nr:hypothetical protein KC19_4G175400 [Ceratodon purpureus]
MGGSVVRGLLSTRHSSSLVCLTAHSFLPSSSSWPGSAGAGAVTFVRRARFGCIRVREHAELGLGSGLRLGRSLLGVRALSGGRRGGGADALGVGVSKMSRRDPVVCSPSASSSAAEASSSSENVQAMPKVRVMKLLIAMCLRGCVKFGKGIGFGWIFGNLNFLVIFEILSILNIIRVFSVGDEYV